MPRPLPIRILTLAFWLALAAPAAQAGRKARAAEARLAEAWEILAEHPLVDGHNDMPWQLSKHFGNQLQRADFHDTTGTEPPMHTDIARLRTGGVGGVFWSIWVRHEEPSCSALSAALDNIDTLKRLVARHPEDMELALSSEDLRRILAAGRVASMIGIEGGYVLDASLGVLRQLYALGARYVTLTHWRTTRWCDSATTAPEHDGLSPFGEAVLREMNRLGMLADLAHVSAQAIDQALDISRAPVIISHSGAFAINPHPRNVPDELLRKLADKGGLVMVPVGSFFISAGIAERHAAEKAERARLEVLIPGDPQELERQMQAWEDEHPFPVVTVAEVADHIDHIRAVAGVEHVGIGSDFDGVRQLPRGLQHVGDFPNLVAELLRRSWTRDELALLLNGNILRVMESAEQVAEQLQRSEPPGELRLEQGEEPKEKD